jgi:hypothetical protein
MVRDVRPELLGMVGFAWSFLYPVTLVIHEARSPGGYTAGELQQFARKASSH